VYAERRVSRYVSSQVDEETTDKLTGEPKQSFSDDEKSDVDDDVRALRRDRSATPLPPAA
jgi:hypothetical protein